MRTRPDRRLVRIRGNGCRMHGHASHAQRVGDRFTLMKSGCLLACGRAAGVMIPSLLADLYDVSISDLSVSHHAPRADAEDPRP